MSKYLNYIIKHIITLKIHTYINTYINKYICNFIFYLSLLLSNVSRKKMQFQSYIKYDKKKLN